MTGHWSALSTSVQHGTYTIHIFIVVFKKKKIEKIKIRKLFN